MAKRWAILFGAILAVAGLLGFVSNPIVGPDGLFRTNIEHNWVHLIVGMILLIAGTQTERAAALSLDIFGAIFLLLAVLGFSMIGEEGTGMMFGMVHFNAADNWLHLALGIVLLGLGLATRRTYHPVATH